MTLDPLSAISLAGNIAQFISYAMKLISKSHALYKSSEGALAENLDLEVIATSLTDINSRMVRAYSRIPSTTPSTATTSSLDQQSLKSIAESCNHVAKQLLDTLQTLKVQGSHRTWKSVRQAFKSVWQKAHIDDLRERMEGYREQMIFHLVAVGSADLSALQLAVSNLSEKIDRKSKTSVASSDRTRIEILQALEQLTTRRANEDDLREISMKISNMTIQERYVEAEQAILDSLFFPQIGERHEWIPEAHQQTFSWIFKHPDTVLPEWSNLNHWLQSEDGLYWVCGKAGSGKSTLMKYICHDRRTRDGLRIWARGATLVTASCYFWNPGTAMQKSHLGLLQSLLYEILAEHRDLIPLLFPRRWRYHERYGLSHHAPTMSELKEAMAILTRHNQASVKICFFIDGLDEYEGNHKSIVDFLRELVLAPNFKICVSSRPLIVFKDAFDRMPKLQVEDMTRNDIATYVESMVHEHPRYIKLLKSEPERAPSLILEIVNKASGVFFWVFLVVRSLLEGLSSGDRIIDLQKRVEGLPGDLEEYFAYMLGELDSFYISQAAHFFRYVLESELPIPLLAFSFLDEEDQDSILNSPIEPFEMEVVMSRCEEAERRIASRCKGLLEVYRRKADRPDLADYHDGKKQKVRQVGFLHRTVKEFLEIASIQSQFVAQDTEEFCAANVILKAVLIHLKGLRKGGSIMANLYGPLQLIELALHVASAAEKTLHTKLIGILDDLDQIVSRYYEDAGTEKRWFLSLAIDHGLSSYILKRLGSEKSLLTDKFWRPRLLYSVKDRIQHHPHFQTEASILQLLLETGQEADKLIEESPLWIPYLQNLKYGPRFVQEVDDLLLKRGALPVLDPIFPQTQRKAKTPRPTTEGRLSSNLQRENREWKLYDEINNAGLIRKRKRVDEISSAPLGRSSE